MIIDCDTCEVRGKACGDCVVSFLTIPVRPGARPAPAPRESPTPDTWNGVPMDADQRRAVDLFVAGGLVPPLRQAPRADELSARRRRRRAS
ncbi:hypothetical protein [Demequina globuliformis]|uniref:hypothetical protein n=1 Tax=Demequina globuliformis TaxID=676202 RepID=UPI0007862FB6|nr:hypothetical protein [Demequina globuliformis]